MARLERTWERKRGEGEGREIEEERQQIVENSREGEQRDASE